jgi:hypothetical protein
MLFLEGEIKKMEVKFPWVETPWEVNIVSLEISLPENHIDQLLDVVKEWTKRWKKNHPQESTFARKYQVPSFIVRVDYTVDSREKKELRVFEVEEFPGGMGIACQTVPSFEEKFFKLGWPSETYVFVSSERIKGGDDHLWSQHVYPESHLPKTIGDKLVAIRGKVSGWQNFLSNLIWPPPPHQGHKNYGVSWLWEEVPRDQKRLADRYNHLLNTLKWEGVVFKSHGDRSRHIVITLKRTTREEVEKWLGKSENVGIHGGIKAVLSKIPEDFPIYYQRFFWPLKVRLKERPMFGIWRIYVGFNLNTSSWEVLGGFLQIGPTLLLHGGSHTYFLPVALY